MSSVVRGFVLVAVATGIMLLLHLARSGRPETASTALSALEEGAAAGPRREVALARADEAMPRGAIAPGAVDVGVVVTTPDGEPVRGVSMLLLADEFVSRDPGGVGAAQRLVSAGDAARGVWRAMTDARGRACARGVPEGLRVRWSCPDRTPLSLDPARDAVAASWSDEVAALSGVFATANDSDDRRWVVAAACGIVGRIPAGAPDGRAVVRLFRQRLPCASGMPTWDQERYVVVGGGNCRFAFSGIAPGAKLVAGRLEESCGVVAFAGVECDVAEGQIRDVGVLLPNGDGCAEVRLALRGPDGAPVSPRALRNTSGVPRFAAFVSTIDPLPDVRDVTERVVFGEDGRVRLDGLPDSRCSVTGLELEYPYSRYFASEAPARVEFDVPGDDVVEIPVLVAPLTSLELELPVDVPSVDAFTSACVSDSGFRSRKLAVVAVGRGAVLVRGELPLGRWRIVGSVVGGESGWTFDHSVELTAPEPARQRAAMVRAAWLEGRALASDEGGERPAGVWYAPEDLAKRGVWPFWGAMNSDGSYRAAVPVRATLMSRFSGTIVTTPGVGETVVPE